MSDIKELILKHLHKTYHCGWNNTIRVNESNEVIQLDELITLTQEKFNVPMHKSEAYIMYFLIEYTEDSGSIMIYWAKNRGKMVKNIELTDETEPDRWYDEVEDEEDEEDIQGIHRDDEYDTEDLIERVARHYDAVNRRRVDERDMNGRIRNMF